MTRTDPPSLKIRSPKGITNVSYNARRWNGISVYCVTQYTAPGRVWQNLGAVQATVGIVLEQVDGISEPRKRINAPTPRHRYDAGHTSYIPPDVDVWAYADSTSRVRDVRMRFDLNILERLLGEECDRKKWNAPVLLMYDERLRNLGELIWKECEEDQDSPALYGECLTTALLTALFSTSRAKEHVTPRSGLTRVQLKRILEYIDANLLSDLRLAELASIVGLSSSQFGRTFKASTGSSPHRWIMERRVRLAQRLLKETGKSISISADMAGFADQSHFTRAFRTVTGTTPRVWLRHNSPVPAMFDSC